MATRKPGQYTIGSRAVAVAILTEVLDQAYAAAQRSGMLDGYNQTAMIAEELVTAAWDVEYKPNAERLVLIVDASITSDRSRDTASEEPAEPA